MTPSLAIVIPTRNRADLAIEAIRSLLEISDPRLRHVIVSNNSSDAKHLNDLASFCERTRDARLMHIRPPRAMGMAEHWNWAAEEALARTKATHVGLHYDRRVSKPELRLLLDAMDRWPDVPITYPIDLVYPVPPRVHVHQMMWSGGVYEIRTTNALRLASRGLLTDLWQAFPVLVNCIAPRATFDRVRARFGNLCDSTSPESCFGFRFSALEDRYLHLDVAIGIHYGYARSNGLGYMRGETSGTFGDFVRLFGDRPWLDAAPIPGLGLGQNTFYHEYEVVRRETGSDAFPPIDKNGYLNDIARGLMWISDPARQAEMRALLVTHGWKDPGTIIALPEAHGPRLSDRVRQRIALLRADHFGRAPAGLAAFSFPTEARALRYARKYPRSPVTTNDFLSPLEPLRIQ